MNIISFLFFARESVFRNSVFLETGIIDFQKIHLTVTSVFGMISLSPSLWYMIILHSSNDNSHFNFRASNRNVMNEVYVFKVQGLTWLGDVRHTACSTQHVGTQRATRFDCALHRIGSAHSTQHVGTQRATRFDCALHRIGPAHSINTRRDWTTRYGFLWWRYSDYANNDYALCCDSLSFGGPKKGVGLSQILQFSFCSRPSWHHTAQKSSNATNRGTQFFVTAVTCCLWRVLL